MAFQNPRPVLLRLLEERIAVDVVHEHDAEHGGQSREAPITLNPLLHDHDQQVGDERHPDLYLDGIGALPVEVPQREVLLELLEEQLYLPSLAVDFDDVLHLHLHVVGQQRDEPCLFLPRVHVGDDSRVVLDVLPALDLLPEDDMPYPVLHQPVTVLVHRVAEGLVGEVPLHFRDVDDPIAGEFLELGIVDICTVDGKDVAPVVVGGAEHEAVVRGGREADVRGHSLVGMYVGVHLHATLLHATLLPARLRMPAHALEDEVGEERDGGGVEYLQADKPLRNLPLPAVRGKLVLVGGVQVAVRRLEDVLAAAGVRVGQRGAARHQADAQVRQLASLGEHRVRNLAQGVETLDDSIEHDDQMLPSVETLDVALTAVLAAETKDF